MYSKFGLHFSKLLWIFWPLRKFIRIEETPTLEGGSRLLNDHNRVYVFSRFILLDMMVFNIFLREKGMLHFPKSEARPNRFKHTALLCVKKRKGLLDLQETKDVFLEELSALVEHDKRMKKSELSFQTVSIFFSRSPEQNERNFILKSLFPDDENATSLHKLFLLILHAGQVRVQVGEVRTELPIHEVTPQVASRKLMREFQIEFARERTRAQGPAMYTLDAVAQWVLANPETQRLMKTEKSHAKASQKVLSYIEEISSNYKYSTIRALEVLLDFIWTRIFDGVRVKNFEIVADIAKKGQIIWMPCHRSHLDYLLLSYLLTKKGVVAPHIAAGVNLSFWPAGPIFRRGGAFFLRRSFKGNKLYTHVFSLYIDFLLENRFPLEFFQEGGRSRIGKALVPKTGLLSFCVQSLVQSKTEAAYFVPVYFGYDKVMEDDSYARELSGAVKQKESLWQLIKSIRYLFSKYGRVDVSFGTPFSFGSFWEDQTQHAGIRGPLVGLPPQLKDLEETLEARDPRVQGLVKALARRVNQGINATAVASGSALLTSGLLATDDKVFSKEEMLEKVKWLHQTVLNLGNLLGWSVSPSNSGDGEIVKSENAGQITPWLENSTLETVLEEIWNRGLGWNMISKDLNQKYQRTEAKELNLWWYRGTIFHLCAIPGIVAALLIEESSGSFLKLSESELVNQFQCLRELWADELYFPDTASNASLVEAGLRVLEGLGILVREPHSLIFVSLVEEETVALERLRFFARLVRPEIELFGIQLAICAELVLKKGSFGRDEMVVQLVETHRRAFLRGHASSPAFFAKVFASRTFDGLFRYGAIVPAKDAKFELAMGEVQSVARVLRVREWREFVEL
jgi:glycerol-3-phosphate O-acyltransferase